ncbi:hypothetical protein HZA26_00130 [Candidatus Nomurabacteria bacterium]|nr:hypothetical protein [Candidatus Nomurabacteria bacterium]
MSDNRIKLTFSTTAGDLEDYFSLNQPLHAIKKAVMGRMKLDPSQADKFVVTYKGNPLDEGKTIGDLGIPENSVLIIERRDVVKI